jgi:uncharacterized YccA/Bax inhibitor family protein
MRTTNPTLSTRVFAESKGAALPSTERMTLDGTIHRVGFLVVIAVAAAIWPWKVFQTNPAAAMPFVLVGVIGGLITALITAFKPKAAPITAPLYAALEGLFLGGVSAMYEAQFHGIVAQAVGLTFGTTLALLFAYKSGVIRATENFKLGVVAATGGICLVYLATMVLGLFKINVPFIHESGLVGIGFSLFVVVVAALNLVLDFDFIENGARAGAPKYMEWYGAFGVMVTLVWLYVEFLRLLAKLNRRR